MTHCPRCGKTALQPDAIHTCSPKALVLADALEFPDAEELEQAAAELRRLHAENERLVLEVVNRNKRALLADEVVKARDGMVEMYEKLERENDAKDALLRQVLNDICGAKLCEVNSMSSRAEARRLLDKATDAIRARLSTGASASPVAYTPAENEGSEP